MLMIVFTLCYARWLDFASNNLRLLWVIGIYLIVQCALTMAYHVRAILDQPRAGFKWWAALGIAAIASLGLAQFSLHRHLRHQDCGEVIYLCFMGFYGLIFPAYAWLCIFPARH